MTSSKRKEKPYSLFIERIQGQSHYEVRLAILTRDGAGFYEVSPPVRVDQWAGMADGFLRVMTESEPHLNGRNLPDITSDNLEEINQHTWKDYTLEEKFLRESLKVAMQAWEKRQKSKREIPKASFLQKDGTGQLHFVMEAAV